MSVWALLMAAVQLDTTRAMHEVTCRFKCSRHVKCALQSWQECGAESFHSGGMPRPVRARAGIASCPTGGLINCLCRFVLDFH